MCLVDHLANGKCLVTGHYDGSLRLWDGYSYRHLATLREHDGLVRGVDFSPQQNILASIGDDGMIRLWDVETHNLIKKFRACDGHGYRVFFALDGELLLSSGEEGRVRLWNPTTGEALGQLAGFCEEPHHSIKSRLARSNDGFLCVAGDAKGEGRLYDLRNRQMICELEYLRLEDSPVCFAFSPDGRFVAGGTYTEFRSRLGRRDWPPSGKIHRPRGRHSGHSVSYQWPVACFERSERSHSHLDAIPFSTCRRGERASGSSRKSEFGKCRFCRSLEFVGASHGVTSLAAILSRSSRSDVVD